MRITSLNLDASHLTANEEALVRCQRALILKDQGDYDSAQKVMRPLWARVGERPEIGRLHASVSAEVLLCVGVLTRWIGSKNQVEEAQETAKNLITESITFYESMGDHKKVAAARVELAICYWREGAFDEARVTLQSALTEFDEGEVEQRAVALLRRAEVERSSTRSHEALGIYNQAAPLFDKVNDHYLTATFHFGLANVLNQLISVEKRKDYVDMALMEYTAASFHFEQAGHEPYHACVENNLGFLFSTIGKFEDAHEHLDRAQVLMTRLKDNVHLGQVDDTRARVLLAEGRNVEAEKTARAAVRRLEKGDELSLLAEALTTHGIALVRLAHSDQARASLERAIAVAEQVGDFESAGVSALTIIEVLGASLSNEEVSATIDHIGVLLEKTQEAAILRRLAMAFRSLFLSRAVPAPPDWDMFSFKDAVCRYEARLIRLALKQTGGKVTAAARLLGFRHHQNLIAIINSRHKDLLETRSKVRKRRKHLMNHPKRKKKQPSNE